MNYGLHIIETKPNTFIYVGSVPFALHNWVQPTKSDVLGQRVDHDTGLAFRNIVFESEHAAIAHAKKIGFTPI